MEKEFDNMNNENKQINTYNLDELNSKSPKSNQKKSGGHLKGFVIFLVIILVISTVAIVANISGYSIGPAVGGNDSNNLVDYDDDYIGILNIHGEIGESSGEYNQEWLLARIKDMTEDSENKGIMLDVDTPGGAVFETDELYLALLDYKEATHRPVYTYMEGMATSGGYYISMASDKIFANRNCWTGSIGVTIGSVYDVSELLDRIGVKTVTITSGKNKAMGSAVNPLTKEQKDIYQSLVDEAYEQFVDIVAKGRGMTSSEVKPLADGRIYTAAQAKNLGLIDGICRKSEAIDAMKKENKITNCSVEEMEYVESFKLSSLLNQMSDIAKKSEGSSEYSDIMKLMNEDNEFSISYTANIEN